MKRYYIIFLILALIIPSLCLYIIQRTVCVEIQDIMKNAGSYNIFTGCVVQIETERVEFQGDNKGVR